MPVLYLQNRVFGKIKETELQTFLKECTSYSLDYLQRDKNSWQLLPQLSGKIFGINSLTDDCFLNRLLSKLKSQLLWQGASVSQENRFKADFPSNQPLSLNLIMNIREYNLQNYEIYLYYSLRAKEQSLAFVQSLADKLKLNGYDRSLKIMPFWEQLTCFQYYKLLFSETPTVLVEFAGQNALEKFAHNGADYLLNNILDIYGKTISPKQLTKLAKCWKEVKKRRKPFRKKYRPISPGIPVEAIRAINQNNLYPPAGNTVSSDLQENRKDAQTLVKSPPKTAAGTKKNKKKKYYGKIDYLSLQDNTSVKYFIRPKSPQTVRNTKDYFPPAIPGLLAKSTFYSSSDKPGKSESRIQNSDKSEETREKVILRTVIEVLKSLDKFLEK